MPRRKVWECKIGFASNDNLPLAGADVPLRQAVEKAYRDLVGKDAEFCFSGWGGELTETEKDVILGL